MKKFIKKVCLVLLLGIFTIPIFSFNLKAEYESGGTVIGSYKKDFWHGETGPFGTVIRFYDVAPSTDSNLSLSLVSNKTSLVGSKDLYFSFDYGDFYITPFEYYTDYINSGYQYAPYWNMASGDMLRIQGSSLQVLNKGDLVASYTLSQLTSNFPDFSYFYIVQIVSDVSYIMAYNEGYNAARDEYGVYINGEWITAADYGNLQYTDGFILARAQYGVYIIDEWMTANEYGGIRYNAARDEYGILINGEWVSATQYGDIQYNAARDEYGILINGEWVKAFDYGEIKYSDGYQAAIDDGASGFGITTYYLACLLVWGLCYQ